jgi:hypothetical protein
MTKMSSLFVRRFAWLGLAAIVLAIVVVPAAARARQHIERRDATRLSIKHSWIGVAPPTKATITLKQIVTLPIIAERAEPARVVIRRLLVVEPTPHPVVDLSPDLLRGPPPVFFS